MKEINIDFLDGLVSGCCQTLYKIKPEAFTFNIELDKEVIAEYIDSKSNTSLSKWIKEHYGDFYQDSYESAFDSLFFKIHSYLDDFLPKLSDRQDNHSLKFYDLITKNIENIGISLVFS